MAGAASALFLLDIKGRVLVWRDYRGDVSAAQAERFFTKLIEKEVPLFFIYIFSRNFDLIFVFRFRINHIILLIDLIILYKIKFEFAYCTSNQLSILTRLKWLAYCLISSSDLAFREISSRKIQWYTIME